MSPTTRPAITPFFVLPIEDVFVIKGRGLMATGRVEQGRVAVGDEIEVVGSIYEPRKAKVTALTNFKQEVEVVEARQGVERSDIRRGDVVCHPGTVQAYSKIKARLSFFEEERLVYKPFISDYTRLTITDLIARRYRLMWHIHTSDVTTYFELPPEFDLLKPGDNIEVVSELVRPIAAYKGLEFKLGLAVGNGVVTDLIG